MATPQRKVFGRRRLFTNASKEAGQSNSGLLARVSIWAAVIGVGALLLINILREQTPIQNSAAAPVTDNSVAPQTVSATAQNDYGLRVTDNRWPKVEASGDAEPHGANYYIILDGSGSMREVKCSGNQNKMTVASAAVRQFARSIESTHRIGLFVFDEKGRRELVSLAQNNKHAVEKALGEVVSGGATPLGSAIRQGVAALDRQARKQLGYGEYHLVVVTDGEANSNDDPRPEVDRLLKDTPIVLHTIGFCIDGKHSLNRKGVTLYRSANDAEGLSAALEQVLAESPDFNVSSFN